MKSRFEAEYKKLDTQRIVSTNATATDTKNATNKLSEAVAVIQINSREKQGQDFADYI